MIQVINYGEVKSAREIGRLVRQGAAFTIATDPALLRRLRSAARMERRARKDQDVLAALRFGLSACSTLLFWEAFRQARQAGYACRFGAEEGGYITFVPPHDLEQMWLVTEKTRDLRWIWRALELHEPVDRVLMLLRLLEIDWHRKHGEIVSSLHAIGDARAVNGLFRTALRGFPYLAFDNRFDLARKCIAALADIGTVEAFDRLRALAAFDNSVIAGYALSKLVNWQGELPQERDAEVA